MCGSEKGAFSRLISKSPFKLNASNWVPTASKVVMTPR